MACDASRWAIIVFWGMGMLVEHGVQLTCRRWYCAFLSRHSLNKANGFLWWMTGDVKGLANKIDQIFYFEIEYLCA